MAPEFPPNCNRESSSASFVVTRPALVRIRKAAPGWAFPSPNGSRKLTTAPWSSVIPARQVQYSLHEYRSLRPPVHELINRAFISHSVMFIQPILTRPDGTINHRVFLPSSPNEQSAHNLDRGGVYRRFLPFPHS